MRLAGLLVALFLVPATTLACATGAVSPGPMVSAVPASATPVAESAANPSPAPAGSLPNLSLTPGETFAGVTAEQVCVSGYAGRARNVLLEQYRQVHASYGIAYPEPAGTYELDHLVPLELGGNNSNRNLWPEPALPVPGFHQKDLLENYLHAAVCGGRMSLADAQSGIAADWIALYRLYLPG
ncbi:MAG: HNH endonuclease [Candidatus Dormibacteraeota bacterium]|nr:HNH endonuclease [Candidatus Dormibacteraeota bacterium]